MKEQGRERGEESEALWNENVNSFRVQVYNTNVNNYGGWRSGWYL